MSKYKIGDTVRVTYPGSVWFDHVLKVRILSGAVFWAQSTDGPELIPFHEQDIILADHEHEAAQ